MCPYDLAAAFLESRSLPPELSPEAVCFTHLENRVRPQVVDTNMPWWLAILLATPMVLGSLYLIKRWLKKRDEKKRRGQGNADKEEFQNALVDSS
jgi:membrane protein YqaA with SNARE-associated domain